MLVLSADHFIDNRAVFHDTIKTATGYAKQGYLVATAQDYLASGEYYWNSGMFMFLAKCYLQELEKFRPDILEACCRAMANVKEGNDFISIDKDDFIACPAAVVVPLDAG